LALRLYLKYGSRGLPILGCAAEREDAGRFIAHAHDMFPKKDHAIDYAQNRACFRSGEIPVLDSSGNVERTIGFTRRIEGCDYGAGCLLGGSVRVVFPPYSRDMALSAGRA
jgi:hypothetical protein